MRRKTTVADEFEIDPKQNNGLNYQYHDVQRGRAERKLMHGGDCECCTGVRPRSLHSLSPYLTPLPDYLREEMLMIVLRSSRSFTQIQRRTSMERPLPGGRVRYDRRPNYRTSE